MEMLILCMFSLYHESNNISEKLNGKFQNAFGFGNLVRPPFALITLDQLT